MYGFARPLRFLASALAALGVAACADQAPTGIRPPDAAAHGDRVGPGPNGRHVIVMKDGASTMNNLVAQVQALGGQVVRTQPDINVLTVQGLTDAAAAALSNRGDVDGIRQDESVRMIPPRDRIIGRVMQAQSGQSGAAFFTQFQWNMRQIRADKAWAVTKQGTGALVCILDTGIDPNHIDLQGKVDLGISTSFVAAEPDILDRNFHGTFVSALVSSNGLGIASVAPDARLCTIKVIDQTGSGSFSDLISGIMYAAQHGADVINMSLGAYVQIQTRSDVELIVALQRAIDFAKRRGTVAVAAAGNDTANLARDARNVIEIPAQLAGVISVGATAPVNQQHFDAIASYSNVGFPGVDVFAPGGDLVAGGVLQDLIISACSGLVPGCESEQTYVLGAGTSFSSPHVAGEAAVISSDFPRDPRVDKVTACIERTADHPRGLFIDPLYGFGRIDVLRAAICGGRH